MNLDNADSRYEDMFYSAVMLNTEVTYKTLCDLKDNYAIRDYRDLHDKEILREVAKGEFKLRPDTVLRIIKLLGAFGDLEKIVDK